jgi:hypothetical protein
MDLATATLYRAPTFHAPRRPSANDVVEVIASWGDAVLSVTHVGAGEGFVWEGASVLNATAEGWAVTVPEEGSAWALRDGETTLEPLRAGASRALAADERVCVAVGEVTLRIVRTAPPEALPRARWGVGFASGVAFLLALVASGLALAAPEDDGTIARDDTAERAWLAAHVRPYVTGALASQMGTQTPPRSPVYGLVNECCKVRCFGANDDGAWCAS